MSDTPNAIDLAPAKWIWFPGERCLRNTFILFRRVLRCEAKPRSAHGYLTADSRYRLTINGKRVQWGPAPCDPRWQDVDPVDLTPHLEPGENVIGVEVCYFGAGDGTWPMGAPGFIGRFDFEHADGSHEKIITDESWGSFLDRAHRPGQYQRWFLRAMQEEYDARLHPHGWDAPAFAPDERWLPARVLPGASNLPAIFAGGPEYVVYSDLPAAHTDAPQRERPHLRVRTVPPMRETIVDAKEMTDAGRVRWRRDPLDWFESRVPNSFDIESDLSVANRTGEGVWQLPATPQPSDGVYATFRLPEQVVGFPRFTIDAPAGTIIEMMYVESHDPANGPKWLERYIYHWSRFVCREGVNEFECFDYESLGWIQLHVRNASRAVTISNVGVRRRTFPWRHEAYVRCDEPALQRLFDASVNTLNNSAHEHIVDGMGRERQQYSGDGGHQLQAVRYTFGETRNAARFLTTFSQGLTLDGYFLDCWPAYDRLARLAQRQIGTTVWGPILDHGVGFNFDCWQHYMETGDREAVREPYPRLLRFARYLESIRGDDRMMPVENIGVPSVWIDHWAFRRLRHKRCAFNLYIAAMLRHALANLCRVFGDDVEAKHWERLSDSIRDATIGVFWCAESRAFVNNLPWKKEEGETRMDDRSLATAILYDLCPRGDTAALIRTLAECPPEMGLSYPANAGWRLQALAKVGRTDVIVNDFRTRWATMNSVVMNNSLQEVWDAKPDTGDQFSHCPLAPLFVLMTGILGIKPLSPGFERYEIRPRLADLGKLDVVAHTAKGAIEFLATPVAGGHEIRVTVPRDGRGEFVTPDGSRRELAPGASQSFRIAR